jgi:hypothetical protein
VSVPLGFGAIYKCEKHPDREVVAPIACRRCQECHDDAIRNYAALIEREPKWLPEHDRTPWGEKIDERRVKRRKERIW